MPKSAPTTTSDPKIATAVSASPKNTQAPIATSGGSASRKGADNEAGTYRWAQTSRRCAAVPNTIVAVTQKYAEPDIRSVPAERIAMGVINTAAAASTPEHEAERIDRVSTPQHPSVEVPARVQEQAEDREHLAGHAPAPAPGGRRRDEHGRRDRDEREHGVPALDALAEEQHGDDDDHDRLERPDQRHVEEARLVDRGERRRGAGCEERACAEHE